MIVGLTGKKYGALPGVELFEYLIAPSKFDHAPPATQAKQRHKCAIILYLKYPGMSPRTKLSLSVFIHMCTAI